MPSERRVTLDALLAEPSRATQVPRGEAVALLVQLATLQTTLLTAVSRVPAAGFTAAERPPHSTLAPSAVAQWSADDLMTVAEAAAMLRLSPRWLYRHAKTLPFSRKLSRKVLRFSRVGIAKWLAMKRL